MIPMFEYAIAASKQALEDANWKPTTEAEKESTVCGGYNNCLKGVAIGAGVIGFDDILSAQESWNSGVCFKRP